MAMVFCRGCGKEIHESAPTCPHCGAPQSLTAASAGAAGVGPEGFMDLALQPLKKYATFQGRARRKEYWFFVLASYVLTVVAMFIHPALYGLLSLGFLLPSIAAGVRRMHDTDRSGWWLLLPIANLVFLCLPGNPGANRFGPSPK